MYLKKLLETKKSVFLINDLVGVWKIENKKYLRVLISRMVKRGSLRRISRGVYSYGQDFNEFELANKYRKPSYVSLERVLFDEGVIFQDYSKKVTCVGKNSFSKNILGVDYEYCRIKDEILLNPLGIYNDGVVVKAEVERAICDMVYLVSGFHFDNLRSVNKKKLSKISKIYNNRVLKEVEEIC